MPPPHDNDLVLPEGFRFIRMTCIGDGVRVIVEAPDGQAIAIYRTSYREGDLWSVLRGRVAERCSSLRAAGEVLARR